MILNGTTKQQTLSVLPRINPNTLKRLPGLSLCIMEDDDMQSIELTEKSARIFMDKCAEILGYRY